MNDLAHVTNRPPIVSGPSVPRTDSEASVVLYIKPTTRADVDAVVRNISNQGWCIDAAVASGHTRLVFVRYAAFITDLQGIRRDLSALDIDFAVISC